MGINSSNTGVSGVLNPELFRFSGGGLAYPNPLYRYIHSFIPSNLLELFSWCEFIYNNSPQLATSIRRFSEYPVTSVSFPKDDNFTKKYEEYFYTVNLKELMISCGVDFHVYGNAFVSPYYPFSRHAVCSKCKSDYLLEKLNYKFDQRKGFTITCPNCETTAVAKAVYDRKNKDPKNFKWIRWDPKSIEIEFNPISNEAKYLLTIPQTIIDGVNKGNLQILQSTPLEILQAVTKKKRFLFKSGTIYHMKANCPAGFPAGWGFPLLTQALYEVLHIAVLKRANEAIAWEHIVPKNIISPAPSGTAGDALKHISLSKWKAELITAKDRWNRDPNYVMFAPFPVNVQQLGGQGRSLMVSAEIEAAERNLAMALGIPLEFAAGTLSWQTSAMSLRLLKNQMHTMVSKLERLIQWIVDTTSRYLGWPTFKVTLEPFELSDDETRKQILLNLNTTGKVSDKTLFTSLGLDYEEELEKLKDEQLAQHKMQQELQQALLKQQQAVTTAAQRAETLSAPGMPGQDLDAAYQMAQQIAQQLVMQSPGVKNQALEQIKTSNPAMFAMVNQVLQNLVQMRQGQEAQLEMSNNAAMAGMSPMAGAHGTVLAQANNPNPGQGKK